MDVGQPDVQRQHVEEVGAGRTEGLGAPIQIPVQQTKGTTQFSCTRKIPERMIHFNILTYMNAYCMNLNNNM